MVKPTITLWVDSKRTLLLKDCNLATFQCYLEKNGSILHHAEAIEFEADVKRCIAGELPTFQSVTGEKINSILESLDLQLYKEIAIDVQYTIPVVCYPYGDDIGSVSGKPKIGREIKYMSKQPNAYEYMLKRIETSFSQASDFELQYWMNVPDKPVRLTCEEVFLNAVDKTTKGPVNIFCRVPHAPYDAAAFDLVSIRLSTINGQAVGADCIDPLMKDQDLLNYILQLKTHFGLREKVSLFHSLLTKQDLNASKASMVTEWKHILDISYHSLKLVQDTIKERGDFNSEALRRLIVNPVVTAACAMSGACQSPDKVLWSDKRSSYPSNLLGHGPLDYWVSYDPPADPLAEDPPAKRMKRTCLTVCVELTQEEHSTTCDYDEADDYDDDDEEEEGGFNIQQSRSSTKQVVKTTTSLPRGLPKAMAQTFDSTLQGAEDRIHRVGRREAPIVEDVRCFVVTTGQRYFFYRLRREGVKSALEYLGFLHLAVLPNGPEQKDTRDSFAYWKPGGAEKKYDISRESFDRLCIAMYLTFTGQLEDVPMATK